MNSTPPDSSSSRWFSSCWASASWLHWPFWAKMKVWGWLLTENTNWLDNRSLHWTLLVQAEPTHKCILKSMAAQTGDESTRFSRSWWLKHQDESSLFLYFSVEGHSHRGPYEKDLMMRRRRINLKMTFKFSLLQSHQTLIFCRFLNHITGTKDNIYSFQRAFK